jgi:hypothetical protein
MTPPNDKNTLYKNKKFSFSKINQKKRKEKKEHLGVAEHSQRLGVVAGPPP